MIHRTKRITDMQFDLIQRIELAHRTCQNIVQDLRDASLTIWTGTSLSGNGRSAVGWIQHFQSERARLLNLRDTVGPIIQRVFPELVTPIADYMQDVPGIVADIQTAIDLHGQTNEPLTTPQRSTLANAIEARLEA